MVMVYVRLASTGSTGGLLGMYVELRGIILYGAVGVGIGVDVGIGVGVRTTGIGVTVSCCAFMPSIGLVVAMTAMPMVIRKNVASMITHCFVEGVGICMDSQLLCFCS